jgi:hypothetical protein
MVKNGLFTLMLEHCARGCLISCVNWLLAEAGTPREHQGPASVISCTTGLPDGSNKASRRARTTNAG